MRRALVIPKAAALAVTAAAVISIGVRAQQGPKADAEYLRKAYETFRTMTEASPYRAGEWQYLGPKNVSGRATDIAVADRAGGRRIYVGYATSGIWKTDDNGATWQSMFDRYATSSIGDLAVAPSNPDVLWVGTGEANIFRASMPGVGVYKSTDGGATFTHMGLTDTQTISRIIVHPTNPDTVYVAASGHEWTDNEARGVYKTTDGGKSWTKVLYKSPRTGAIDLVMDPRDPNTLYAAAWQRVRRKWSDPRVEPGYVEGGVWKTTDGGARWNDASQGFPAAQFRGRIGIDIARSNPNVLYAFIDNYEPGRPPQPNERDAYGRPINESRIKAAEVYRTDDKGATWRKVSGGTEPMDRLMSGHSGTYGWVFGQIRVDPSDENTLYTLGLGLNMSKDGGKTFTSLRGMHSDHHGLWIDPKNPAVLYNANDGGAYLSEDAGKTWRFAVAAGGAHFYNVALDTNSPPWIYGSVQDHGSRRGRINLTDGRDRIPAVDWENAPGGEGSHQAIDFENPNVIYSHGFYGNFTREDISLPEGQRGRGAAAGGQAPPAPTGPQRVTTIRPKEEGLRAQWMAPIIVSPHSASTIYAGYQYVFRSKDKGATWEKISPDLSANDPKQMLPNSSNQIPYQTIVALGESTKKPGLIYAGTDDGRLHVTRDDGKTWTDLTKSVPTTRWISRVVPSQHSESTMYVTQRGREDDDFAPYIYRSTDFGKTFTSIAGNIPAGSVNVIREDPMDPNILYSGTDFGAFVSTNGGRTWEVLGGNLPSVQVSDLQYASKDNLIVIATYGRGMYVMDAAKVRPVK